MLRAYVGTCIVAGLQVALDAETSSSSANRAELLVNDGAVRAILAAMAERVGPLIGMPRGASATSVDDAISGLITPVRGLDIK